MTQLQSLRRWWRHLTMTRWQQRRIFPEAALQAITRAVHASEQHHGGEIRVAIEADWPISALWQGLTPRQRAVQVFVQLHVWDTRARNGVLIYLSLADRQVEIVADRGLDSLITDSQWQYLCRQLEQGCAAQRHGEAVCAAVRQVGELLARHFPQGDRNEQSDRPVLL